MSTEHVKQFRVVKRSQGSVPLAAEPVELFDSSGAPAFNDEILKFTYGEDPGWDVSPRLERFLPLFYEHYMRTYEAYFVGIYGQRDAWPEGLPAAIDSYYDILAAQGGVKSVIEIADNLLRFKDHSYVIRPGLRSNGSPETPYDAILNASALLSIPRTRLWDVDYPIAEPMTWTLSVYKDPVQWTSYTQSNVISYGFFHTVVATYGDFSGLFFNTPIQPESVPSDTNRASQLGVSEVYDLLDDGPGVGNVLVIRPYYLSQALTNFLRKVPKHA